MNIIGIKNNLVKFIYEEDIKLSELVAIKDASKAYIAQVLHLEANRGGKSAVAKLIFCYDGQIKSYDGSIPSVKSEMALLDTSFVLNEPENALTIGKADGKPIVVDFDVLKDNPIILSEKFYVTKVFLNNIALQLQARKQKLVVFDTAGIFKNNKLTLGQDFKLPLNASAIDFVYEKIFDDATPESKAMIQSIFEELGEYAKTVDYIPFDSFKSVIDSEFARTKLIQLIILKNKVKELQNHRIFAQTDEDILPLRTALENNATVVIDLSKFSTEIQNEGIKYVYSIMNSLNAEFYSFVSLSGDDKGILDELMSKGNIHTTVICDYDYANLTELKKVSKNMFLFSPLKQQADYGTYNSFLQKLSEEEFIAYGKMTKFVPIIAKLVQISGADIKVPVLQETPLPEPVEACQPKPEIESELAEVIEQVEDTVVAEEVAVEEVPVEPSEIIDINEAESQLEQEAVSSDEAVEDSVEEVIDETDEVNNIPEQDEVQIDVPVAEPIDEIQTPVIEDNLDEQVAQVAGATAQEIEPVQEVEPVIEDVLDNQVAEQEQATVDEVSQALSEVPDISEDDELSDDDLDMIEELSKPDEEIPAISEPAIYQEEASVIEEVAPQETEFQEEVVHEPQEAYQQEQIEEIQDEPAIPQPPQQTEPIPTRASSTPVVPEYSAEIPEEDKVNSDVLQQGDRVFHEEFGEGVVEKMINYGDKILCSVNFTNVGRRLLNPDISEMKKI